MNQTLQFYETLTAILLVMTQSSTISFQTLPNGLQIVHEAMPWLPSLSFNFLFPYGSATDPVQLEGSASVLSDWLYRGTQKLSSRDFSDTLDSLGVRRGGGSGKEYSNFSGSLLASSFKETLSLYKDMFQTPLLSDEEFASARNLALQELASLADNPTQQLFETLSLRYFASAHGNSSYGTEKGLTNLSPDLLRQDFGSRLSPNGAILSVAGGISWQEVLDTAKSLFADWQGPSPHLPEIKLGKSQQEHIFEESMQTQIGLAYESVAPGQLGWYENAIAMSVLSGGMGARLFSEIREKRGLVYSVVAASRTLKDFGYTLAYAGTSPDRANETLTVLLAELRNIAKGISSEELERARTGLLSQLVMQGESSGAKASALARDIFLLGEPREMAKLKEELLALTLKQVNGFLSAQPDPEFTILSLGSKALDEVLV